MSEDARALSVGQLLRVVGGAATAAAGLVHLDAAEAHADHAHVAAFFVALGTVQLLAAALLVARPSRALTRAVAGGTAAVMVLWFFSRTTGIAFVPDVGAVEPVGLQDAVATILEGVTLASLGLLALLPAAASAAIVTSADRAVGAVLAATLLAAVPAVVAGPAHHHDARHSAAAHGGADGATHDAADRHELAAAVAGRHAHDGAVVASGHQLVGEGHTGDLVHASARHVQVPAAAHGHDPAGGHGTHGGPSHGAPPAIATWHAPKVTPEGIAATVRYGPFSLPPASSDAIRERNALLTNVVLTNLARPCEDCYLTMMEPDLVYADGAAANYDTGVMLHHNVLAQSWHEDPTCSRESGIGMMGLRFFAAGNERTAAAFPPGFGVRVDDSPWTGIFEIMNHRDVPQTVYFQLHVRYLPASTKGMKALTPLWLDVDNCGDSEFPVGPGRTVTDWDWASTVTGRVVTTAGHVHDGGVSIELLNATHNHSMCRSVAGYGTKPAFMGAIESMSVCSWDRIGVVRTGEVVRIRALYDTPEPLPDVMGIMMAFVHETDDLDGGTAAPREMTHPPDNGAPPPTAHAHGH